MLKLADIVGQNGAVETIGSAFAAGRLPHGLIFAGPVGVGKGTTAAALAALFLCEKPHGAKACGTCQSCRLFEASNHPDYHLIAKELIRFHDESGKSKGTTLSIQVMRPELIAAAGRTAMLGRGKVFVVEQAELMQVAAQNSMLKTLEEPPGRTLIVLLTDRPQGLLATIRSRCQMVPFAPLDERIVAAELVRRGMERDLAAQAARMSGGSLGLAIRWVEDGVVEAGGRLLGTLQSSGEGGELAHWFKEAADAYAEKQLERDELASKEQATRQGLMVYLGLTAGFYRRRLEAPGDDAGALDRACAAIEAVARAQKYVEANVNLAITLEQLGLALGR